MPVPIERSVQMADWMHANIRPLLASLAGQGKIDGIEAMQLLEGLDGIQGLVGFFEKYGDRIKAAVAKGLL